MNHIACRLLAVVTLAVSSLGLVACGSADDSSAPGDEQDLTAKPGRFETFKGQDGRYYFHLLAANGEKVLQSQAYTALSSAKKGIDSVRTNGVDAGNFDELQAVSGEYYLNLVAGNNQIIATTETYATKSNADRALKTIVGLVGRSNRAEAAATGGAAFQAFKGLDGQYYFHLRAGNGEIMLQSEGYKAKSSALTGIDSVRTNGGTAAGYEVLEANDGQYFFHLTAANGETIGHGETYTSEADANRAVKALADLIHSEKVADAQ